MEKPTFVLTSKSKLKYNALAKNNPFELFLHYPLDTVVGNDTETPQPFGIDNTFTCAVKRMANIKSHRYVISIENGVFLSNGVCKDVCMVVVHDTKTKKYYSNRDQISKTAIVVPEGPIAYNYEISKKKAETGLGFTKTFGSYFAKEFGVPHNDWMKYLCDFPRERQIKIAFLTVLEQIENDNENLYPEMEDFFDGSYIHRGYRLLV